MINLNSVTLLGKVTLPPRMRSLKSGMQVGEIGIGIPESFRKKNGEWETRMNFVEVVAWDQQADFAQKELSKGDGVLVQGSLQFEQWEDREGRKRNRLRVKAQRIQKVVLPEPAASAPAA